ASLPWEARTGLAILVASLVLSLAGLDFTLIVPKSTAQIDSPEEAIIRNVPPACRDAYSPTFQLIGPATISSELVTLPGADRLQLRASASLMARRAGVQPRGYSVIAPPLPPGETNVAVLKPDANLLRAAGICVVVSSMPVHDPNLSW